MDKTQACWWVIHDDALRAALEQVESGDVTASEAHAVLMEHSDDHSLDNQEAIE